jgi:hypothetical protein
VARPPRPPVSRLALGVAARSISCGAPRPTPAAWT